jgi:hypothetical protein
VGVVTTVTGVAKDDRDHAVACANLGVSLTKVILDTRTAIDGKTPPQIASYLKDVSSVLPPDLAAGFYKTFQPKLKTADALMDSELANLAKAKSKLRLTDCGIE